LRRFIVDSAFGYGKQSTLRFARNGFDGLDLPWEAVWISKATVVT